MIPREARRLTLAAATLTSALFALLELFSWGFTVDDALITARVAVNLRSGAGYRFNALGPVTDAVTPLGFAPLLAVLSRGDVLVTMHFAKWFGALAGLVTAALVGAMIARTEGRSARFTALLPFVCSAPLGAWCVSGMETGLVVLLATLAVALPAFGGAVVAGVAAAWRPELAPWALTLAAGTALVERSGKAGKARDVVLPVAVVVTPALVVAMVRALAFGHPAPLAVWAKPSDAAHGLFYVAACLLWTGAPILVVAARALRDLDGRSRVVLVAAGVHCLALVAAGGDWMALFRLFVPVLPGLVVVGARLAARAPFWATALRVSGATLVSLVLLFDKGVVARRIGAQREALIVAARPVLASSRAVAALDVGWVGAAFPGTVVDLAGVTDETIAKLPGGHTTKRVTAGMLLHRGVDRLVLLTEGPPAPDERDLVYVRGVEARLGRSADLELDTQAVLELAGTAQCYVVLGMKNAP